MKLRDVVIISGMGLVLALLTAGCEAPPQQTEVPDSVYGTDHLEDFDTVYDPETKTYVRRESIEVVPEAEPELIIEDSYGAGKPVEIEEVDPDEMME